MKKLSIIVSSAALALAASSTHATLYNVEVDLDAVVSGGGGGSQTGSGSGVYDDVTEVMTLTSEARVVANGMFGIGAGTMEHEYESEFDFSTNTGTNSLISCVNVSGSACSFTPVGEGPEALDSVSDINFDTMQFETVSTFSIATTTQTWTITKFEPVPVPAAAWMFGSALLGLAGVARRRINAA